MIHVNLTDEQNETLKALLGLPAGERFEMLGKVVLDTDVVVTITMTRAASGVLNEKIDLRTRAEAGLEKTFDWDVAAQHLAEIRQACGETLLEQRYQAGERSENLFLEIQEMADSL